LFDSAYQALLYLPAYVLVGKLIPEGVESSIMGIMKGLQSFSVLVYGRIFGSLIAITIAKQTSSLQDSVVIFFGLIVLGASALMAMMLTRIIPKSVDIEAT